MMTAQMELGLENGLACRPASRRSRSVRADWWFSKMRQIVDRAFDWETAVTPRPQQIWLAVPQHPTLAGSERQICE
jgi:hypothetical protein